MDDGRHIKPGLGSKVTKQGNETSEYPNNMTKDIENITHREKGTNNKQANYRFQNRY